MKQLIEKCISLNELLYLDDSDETDSEDEYERGGRGRGRGRGRGGGRGRGRGRGRRYYNNIRNENNSDKEGNKIIVKNKSFLFEFIFTYFDFCLIFFFKDRKNMEIYDMFNYWLKSNNEIFKFYCDYKYRIPKRKN